MALDCTVGGTGTNSYVCRSEADAYFADRIDASTWAAATTTARDQALVTATTRLEQESYTGTVVFIDQALAWPRYGTYDRDGFQFDHESLPISVRQACMELALALLKDSTLLDDTGLEGLKNVSLGTLDVAPRARRAGTLPATVARMIEPVRLGGSGTKVYRA